MCLSSPAYRSRHAKIDAGTLFDKLPAAVGGDVDRDVLQSVCFVDEKDGSLIQPPVLDPARVHLDEHTTNLVTESLRLLGNFDVDVRTQGDATQYDAARQHIARVVEYVNGTVDELHGKESKEAIYFRANGKCLVIQETNVAKMVGDNEQGGYYSAAGQNGGLNINHRPYIDRVHIVADCREGAYLANNLGDNYHYQVQHVSLSSYLLDLYQQNIKIAIAGMDGCGIMDETGRCQIPHPSADQPDGIIYTSNTPFAISYGKATYRKGGDLPDEVIKGPTMLVAVGRGIDELRRYADGIPADKFYSYMSKNDTPEDGGASQRNQKTALSFGLNFLDCTNTERKSLHEIPSPQVTKSYDKQPGLEENDTMADSMKKTLVSMTELMDALCRLFDIDKLFDIPERTATFAHDIAVGNRLEKCTVGLSDLLACHTDYQNGRVWGYSGNISYFKYVRNYEVTDPTDKNYFERVHVGGYGRKICDSTLEKANIVSDLLDELVTHVDRVPDAYKLYSVEHVLVPQNTDQATEFDSNVVARRIHLNKWVFFSFYLHVIFGWINRRKARCPVSFHELLDAIHSAVRWTSSPSTWAHIFNELTHDNGVEIIIPKGLEWKGHLFSADSRNRPRKMPLSQTYESPLPLWVLYIFKSIEIVNGVGRGGSIRFQQNANGKINLQNEEKSMRNFYWHVNELEKESAKVVHNFGLSSVNSDAAALKLASMTSKISEKFITGVSKRLDAGGVLGIGELLGHHLLGIFSMGGYVHPVHALNANFCKGNHTAHILLDRYGLSIPAAKKLMKPIATNLKGEFGVYAQPCSENTVCKLGQDIEYGVSKKNSRYDTVCIATDSFLAALKEGVHTAMMAGGSEAVILSGQVSSSLLLPDSRHRFDVRVVRSVAKQFAVDKVFNSWEFSPSTKKAEKIMKRKLKKQTRVRGGKPFNQRNLKNHTRAQEIISNHWGEPSQVWGYVQPVLTSKARTVAMAKVRSLAQEVMHNRTMVILDLGDLTTMDVMNTIIRSCGNAAGSNITKIIDEAKLLVDTLISTDEDYNERQKDKISKEIREYFDLLSRKTSKRGPLNVVPRNPKRQCRRVVEHTSPADDPSPGHNERDRKDDGIVVDRLDLDGTYADKSFETSLCVESGKRLIPNYSTFEGMPSSFRVNFDLIQEISKAAKMPVDQIHLHFSSCQYNEVGWRYYNCKVTVGGMDYTSSDTEFLASERGKNMTPFPIGMRRIGDWPYYESKTHAQFALYMVLLSRLKLVSAEDSFMKDKDIAIIVPNEKFAYDMDEVIHDKFHMPICALMRTATSLLAVDMDQLRFMRFVESSRCTCNGVVMDKAKLYFDNESKKWKSKPSHMVNYFEMKLAKATLHNIGLVQYIGLPRRVNGYHLPLGTIKTVKYLDKSTKGIPCGWIQLQVETANKRVCTYYRSPLCRHEFRSLPEVKIFLKCLEETCNDERKALELFRPRNKERIDTERVDAANLKRTKRRN